MRLWLSHHNEVPIREQLVTQVVLGIVSDDLRPGQRLPSTRELARRFKVHPNTVSAAYKQLEREGWVEFRRGSGIYVRASKPAISSSPELALEQLIAGLFRAARELGAPLAAVRARMKQWLELQPPDHFLLIEPDEDLRNIVIDEIRSAVEFPVKGAGLDACEQSDALAGAIPLALPRNHDGVRRALPAGSDCIALHLRSVPESLAPWLRARRDILVAVVSRSKRFLENARTVLLAAGFQPDGLLFRDARRAGWQKGLSECAAVICDSRTAAEIPKACKIVIPFSLLSEASIKELKECRDFAIGSVVSSP
jgi:DNA-binding transcriptional regulator YhcF (GntR family)